jgi:uncharacterized protein YqiB (DUF1249 family)
MPSAFLRAPPTLASTPPAHSFAALMDFYETSYIRLRLLAPALEGLRAPARLPLAEGLLLRLAPLDHGRFSQSVRFEIAPLTDAQGWHEPRLTLRLYHDLRLAEALSCCRERLPCGHYLDRAQPGMSELEWRWRLNAFLHRLLGYCLKQGCRLPAD